MSSLRDPTTSEQRWGLVVTLTAIAGIIALQWIIFANGNVPLLIYGLHMNFGFAPFAALLVFCCARYRNPIIGALSSKMAVTLGEASYSIYLVHLVIIFKLRIGLPVISDLQSALAVSLRIVFGLSLTLAISFASWRFIEMPARRFVRNRFGRGSLSTKVRLQPASDGRA